MLATKDDYTAAKCPVCGKFMEKLKAWGNYTLKKSETKKVIVSSGTDVWVCTSCNEVQDI